MRPKRHLSVLHLMADCYVFQRPLRVDFCPGAKGPSHLPARNELCHVEAGCGWRYSSFEQINGSRLTANGAPSIAFIIWRVVGRFWPLSWAGGERWEVLQVPQPWQHLLAHPGYSVLRTATCQGPGSGWRPRK